MSAYYSRTGQPISMEEWTDDRSKDLVVAKTEVPEADAEVSTVYLGIDHSWDGGPPLIFETMIFGGLLDQYQKRWTTEDQAREGHQEAIDAAKEAQAVLSALAEAMAPALRIVASAAGELAKRFDLYDDDRTIRLLIAAAKS